MAVIQQKIVGFVGAEPGEVTLLFVLPEASGKGIGKQLFEFGLARARDASASAITVVATKNSASFYELYGFRAIEEQSFVRGSIDLAYPVVKMVQPSENASDIAKTDA